MPFLEEEAQVEGGMLQGEVEEKEEEGETPEWLAEAIEPVSYTHLTLPTKAEV